MGADIHGSIEYSDWLDEKTGEPNLVMSFANKIHLGRIYSMFGALGYGGRDLQQYCVVPLRGWPKTKTGDLAQVGWGWREQAEMLVIRDAKANENGFDERGYRNEGDGGQVTLEKAEEYIKYGSEWLLRPHDKGDNWQMRYISHPDIHSVNWVTSAELSKAIASVARLARKEGHRAELEDYRAVVAAMRALEKDPQKKMVRFIYGFDN